MKEYYTLMEEYSIDTSSVIFCTCLRVNFVCFEEMYRELLAFNFTLAEWAQVEFTDATQLVWLVLQAMRRGNCACICEGPYCIV